MDVKYPPQYGHHARLPPALLQIIARWGDECGWPLHVGYEFEFALELADDAPLKLAYDEAFTPYYADKQLRLQSLRNTMGQGDPAEAFIRHIKKHNYKELKAEIDAYEQIATLQDPDALRDAIQKAHKIQHIVLRTPDADFFKGAKRQISLEDISLKLFDAYVAVSQLCEAEDPPDRDTVLEVLDGLPAGHILGIRTPDLLHIRQQILAGELANMAEIDALRRSLQETILRNFFEGLSFNYLFNNPDVRQAFDTALDYYSALDDIKREPPLFIDGIVHRLVPDRSSTAFVNTQRFAYGALHADHEGIRARFEPAGNSQSTRLPLEIGVAHKSPKHSIIEVTEIATSLALAEKQITGLQLRRGPDADDHFGRHNLDINMSFEAGDTESDINTRLEDHLVSAVWFLLPEIQAIFAPTPNHVTAMQRIINREGGMVPYRKREGYFELRLNPSDNNPALSTIVAMTVMRLAVANMVVETLAGALGYGLQEMANSDAMKQAFKEALDHLRQIDFSQDFDDILDNLITNHFPHVDETEFQDGFFTLIEMLRDGFQIPGYIDSLVDNNICQLQQASLAELASSIPNGATIDTFAHYMPHDEMLERFKNSDILQALWQDEPGLFTAVKRMVREMQAEPQPVISM